MSGVVSIKEFMSVMKRNGLLIVSKEDYEQKINFKEVALKNLQKTLLNKEYLTIKEIVKAELLPVKTRQSINNWIDKGVFCDGEVYKNKEGVICIVTSGIRRIRCLKNLETW